MKVGDLVQVKECEANHDLLAIGEECPCWFCAGKSNRIGYVIAPATRNSWMVVFDCGEYRLDEFDQARGYVEVISESR